MSKDLHTLAMFLVPSAFTLRHSSTLSSAASTAVYAAQWITASGFASVITFSQAAASVLMGGRAMIERQVRRDVSDLEEAKRQYGLTRNPEYLRFMTLRAEGLLEDNKILTPDSRSLLQDYAQWARERQEREDKKQAKKARKAEKKARQESAGHEADESADAAAKNEENKAADGS